MELRSSMWQQLVIAYPHKRFDKYRRQPLVVRRAVMGLTYRSTMCCPNLTTSKFVVIFIFLKKIKLEKIAFSLKKCFFTRKTIPHYYSS